MVDTNRVALVTGGSGGIGRAVVERLASDGLSVVVAYSGNQAKADEVVQAVAAKGGRALAARADIADEAEAASLFDAAESEFGGVDVVVNSAGIMLLAPLSEYPLDNFDRMIRTNTRGAFVISQLAALRVRQGGAIIGFSSSVTKLSPPTYAAYAASKAAVEAITLILARELRGRDITVNSVAPGPTATELYFKGKTEEQIKHGAEQSPLGRLGVPDDIAEVVSFLAGPARWVNGQIIYINGGVI